jgi:hypothetical protein
MEMPEKRPRNSRLGAPIKLLLAGVLAAATSLLQGCSGSIPYGVKPGPGATLQAIQITPSNSLIQLGATRQLIAVGVYSDGSKQNISPTWTSCPFSGTPMCPAPPGTRNYVSVDSNGLATGMALGTTGSTSSILATIGPIVGVTTLTVDTNGYSASTTSILVVPFGNTEVDAAYLPMSKTTQGVYTVQEVNLDADQFSSVLPVPTAVIGSVPMPAGFVPNATAASQSSFQVAVISYTSPNVQVIDASNILSDLSSNTVVATYTAPVSKSVTFNGISCMICAATVNPTNSQLILSTAQGYYSMDLTSGKFTAQPFVPTAFPAESFALNPFSPPANPAGPLILSPTFGQDPNFPSELQTVNLQSGAVTTNPNTGLAEPNAVAIDLFTNYAMAVDASGKDQLLLNLGNPQNPTSGLASNISICRGQSSPLNMAALGVGIGNLQHTLFLSQPSGNCVGFEVWPAVVDPSNPFVPSNIDYGYGTVPATPEGTPFLNGSDPNAIATFTSVVNKANYGVLVDESQNWIAKFNLGALSTAAGSSRLPLGADISGQILTGFGGAPVVFLPAVGTVSVNPASNDFGNQPVKVASLPFLFGLNNVSTTTPVSISAIAIQGANAGDFTQTNTCSGVPLPQGGVGIPPLGNCTITVIFTPSAAGPRSATISIVNDGGVSPLTIMLTGTGT